MGNSSSRSGSNSKRNMRKASHRTSTPSMPVPDLGPPPPYTYPSEHSKDLLSQTGAASQHAYHLADSEATADSSANDWRTYGEDALDTLKRFDTILIVDDSASMHGERWQEATNALKALASKAGNYDTDGIDIHFLNSNLTGSNMKKEDDVQKLFDSVKPSGTTPIGTKLEDLLRAYISKIEKANASGGEAQLDKIKPINFIIITDGAATDDPESVIIASAKRLDRGNFPLSQVGIQFVQIGDDKRAARFLAKLDDDLSRMNDVRDIVDTTKYGEVEVLTGDVLIKILLGGINRRVDIGGAKAIS